MKKPWQSKTMWLNALGAVSALFIPGVAAWISAHPAELTMVWAGLNMALRYLSKDKITLGD